MTVTQQIITIAITAIATIITRFLPFAVFQSKKRQTPKFIEYLGKAQMLLSIAGGTVCYMLLVQFVFK